MDKKTAQLLIEDTFNNAFNEEQFMVFTKNLLNDLESKNNFYTGNLIWDDYKEYINTYKRIGKYIDPEGEALDVLIVEVKSLTKLERARTALRNFVIKHLSKFEKDYALVAFYSKEDGGADWRFSFIKLEYRSELDEEKGKVKLKKEFTPAKRYSFLVGKYEKAHTAKNQLLPLLQNIANNPTIEELEAAFSIEKVTDEFFSQYKDLYIKLYEHFENDRHVKSAIELAKIDNTRFTKKLLGQIVFLYFLQKKGWLGVAQNERWGTGKKRFVQELFDQAKAERVNFFKDKLQYLFYEALAKERDNVNSYYERFDCRIPFLNGGLFEADYDWQNANITIPESLFRNEEKNKAGDVGTGVLDVFDRYNFTIKEDEPLDKEVAVDPEMLGKVFENMLDIKERKSKGAFYTPREIVHYMCQESLIHYLDNALCENVEKKDIEIFIREGHFALENDERVATKGETKTYRYQLPESIRQNADLIDRKLIDIRICDPAIGSGAFPVGLLHELVNAMLVLKSHLSYDYLTEKLKGFGFEHRESVSDSRYIYRLKRHIIQESIYGVDIDASAIDIARLRLWLSLVVDEDDLDPIETLPNLDYKIVCGNSLISRYALDIPINDVFVEFNKKIKDKNYVNTTIKELIGKDEVNLEFYKKITNDFLIESSHEKKNLFRELIKEIKSAFRSNLNDKEKMKLSKARALVENLQTIDMFGKQTGTVKEITQAKKSLRLLEEERDERLNGQIYKDAIEWRFEFPHLLDDKGYFIGFDVVIGNPPYVGISKVDYKDILEKINYETYATTGDLYVLFYENGYKLLKSNGNVNLITSNKWINASYGANSRNFFAKKTNPKLLIDFGKVRIFPNATVFVNILMLEKSNADGKVEAVTIEGDHLPVIPLQNYFQDKKVSLSIKGEEVWKIGSSKGLIINKTIEEKGLKLKEWKNIEFFRGITSGFNEAFHIDDTTAKNLISQNKKNENIIKPLLRGKDIKRWMFDYHDLYIINTHNGVREKGIKPIKVETEYPEIYKYLLDYYDESSPKSILKSDGTYQTLKNRADQGNHWSNLRNCAFIKEFENPKIIWIEISDKANYAYDEKGHFLTNSAYFISGENLKYLISVLNSTISDYYFFQITAKIAGGRKRYTKQYVEQIPIPVISKQQQIPYEKLVDYVILAKTKADDIVYRFFESLLDGIVFELYFPEEIKSAGKEILKHLGDLKPISDEMSEEEKLTVIQSEFERLYDPNHPVRFAIETLDSVEEVRIIKEALK